VRRRRRDAAAAPEVPLAPLIDMVFTVLVFLVVSASFTKTSGLALELPESAGGADAAGEFEVTIDAALDLAAGGVPTSLAALPGAVRDGLAGRATVVVAADRSVPAGLLVDVYGAAAAGGATRVVLATSAREDAR